MFWSLAAEPSGLRCDCFTSPERSACSSEPPWSAHVTLQGVARRGASELFAPHTGLLRRSGAWCALLARRSCAPISSLWSPPRSPRRCWRLGARVRVRADCIEAHTDGSRAIASRHRAMSRPSIFATCAAASSSSARVSSRSICGSASSSTSRSFSNPSISAAVSIMRMECQAGLSKGEARHTLARAVFAHSTRLRHCVRHPSRCCSHDLDRLLGVQTAFTGMRHPHARADLCQPLLSCNSDRQGLVDVLQSSRARYVVERRDGDARRCTDLRVHEAQVSAMQVGMADEPCRGEDLRQAPVLGIRILRPRREQPVAFSPARLRAPPRVILERARIAQRLSHVLLVPGPDVPRRGRTDSVRAPAQHCLDAIEDPRRGLGAVDSEHRERSLADRFDARLAGQSGVVLHLRDPGIERLDLCSAPAAVFEHCQVDLAAHAR